MYDSGISAASLIEDIKDDVDIALDINDSTYLFFLNTAEQLMYSEVIKEQSAAEVNFEEATDVSDIEDLDNPNLKKIIIEPGKIKIDAAEGVMRYDDIYTIYADKNQLIQTSLASNNIFPNIWYRQNGRIVCETDFVPSKICVMYFVRPALKFIDENNKISGNVMLPVEFLDLIKSKIRGEAYKLANEDILSAKWLNDYNILVENFKIWIDSRRPQFGM